MAKARALDRRRKAIKNIRKITRTMELIATARFKKAMDRASAATSYTQRITALVADLANAGLEVSHPLLQARPEPKSATLLLLTSNRGLCGGYNSNVQRIGFARLAELKASIPEVHLEASGKRGISASKFRGIATHLTYTHFEDKPSFDEVSLLADRYLTEFLTGKLDRLDVAYTRFVNASRQMAVVETLLPLESLAGADAKPQGNTQYEFLPSAESILEEVVPMSFKIKLFKCFLDAAVSEQIARMVAMKSATENADDMIRSLSMAYNRSRQTQITSELLDVVGGVEALKA
jgi:F-type H+-transporting ATPase subunit gamma